MTQILIVEDNVFFRNSLKEILSVRFPFSNIEEATDSKEALQKVNAHSPDIVFTDIRLPGASGLELTRRIKNNHAKITVIVLTSYDLPEYRDAAYKSGANYFFTKSSVRSVELLDLVELIASTGCSGHQVH